MTRKKVNVTIDAGLFDELENNRVTTIGSKKFVEDRSRLYEKLLLMGLAEFSRTKKKLEVLDKIRLDRLNVEKADLEKLGL